MKTRRHSLIWLGLVLPTLAVGTFALVLLNREEQRLQVLLQETARERARTVADNLDLIMAEIQDGILQVLLVASEQDHSRLPEVVKENPFVADYFVLQLQQSGDYVPVAGQGYDKLRESFAQVTPWPWLEMETDSDTLRRPLEAAAKTTDVETPAAEGRFVAMSSNRQAIRSLHQSNVSSLMDSAETLGEAPDSRMRRAAAAKAAPAPPSPPARWGWITPADGQPGWTIWYQERGHATVNGFVLDASAVLAQLRSAFPEQATADILFLLRSPDGDVVGGNGDRYNSLTNSLTKEEEFIAVGKALPGWMLYHSATQPPGSRTVFLLGTLMVALLSAATLGSGTLLWFQARRDAREAALKTTFVSNVSHELRTPLTTIRMYAEMLEEGRLGNEEKRQRYLGTIVDESQRLTRLVDNVLDFSRLEQGKKHYRHETVDLGEVIRKILTSQTPRLQQAGMQLEQKLPPAPLTITTDPDALGQVLVNLTDNAIKYAASGKQLRVSCEGEGDTVHIRVDDAGPGIPRQDRERVFQAFQRLDQSLTSNQPGTGLGLAISRNMLRELGGELQLREAPDGGCRFVISLPRNKGSQQVHPKHQTS